jgi:cell division protein FtsB
LKKNNIYINDNVNFLKREIKNMNDKYIELNNRLKLFEEKNKNFFDENNKINLILNNLNKK